ncbi:MerR family transcriptional regulator [Pedomonas mirosovicensis]|uniref:MerR family transcriptional regulator n=1 Tax=Pedomonas mirosovicensis TaxID=2908641 RepID=UPI00286F5F30|nr:MerR family DNA-binding transcriptional regulator [Pedomonas mirosovicensis]
MVPDLPGPFTITDLAVAFNITPRAIRFYEDQGLINPERRGQSRIYNRRDFVRLAWILRGKRVGFSLAEIREMLDLYHLDDGRTRQLQVTLEKCRGRIAALQEQRDDIQNMIEELEQFCAILESVGPDTGCTKKNS